MNKTSRYDDASAIDVLQGVDNHSILLPDIQRQYVWKQEDIEKLFESIVDDYPIGSYIMWKTTRANINKEKPNLYYFLREYRGGETKNEKAPEVLDASDEITEYYIVLDGQQRITSLNIALYGCFFKGAKPCELYYNLDYYGKIREDDENPEKRFAFLTAEKAETGNWYKIKHLLNFKNVRSYADALREAGYVEEARDDLSMLYERLHNAGLIHYYCINENDYNKALDIFVRVNSTGKKLSKSDLLFSTLIDGWDKGRDNIDKLLESINEKGDGFSFTREYLMRLALVLVGADAKLRIQSWRKETKESIRNNWDKIKAAVEGMVSVLVDVGQSAETLTSLNATMPIVYYLFRGGRIKDSSAKKEVKKFLSVAMAKGLFNTDSNSALNNTRNALKSLDFKKVPFSISLFEGVKFAGGRSFRVTKNEVKYWLENYEKGNNTFVLLTLLYPDLKMSQVKFDQDHCHPYDAFDKKLELLSLSDEQRTDWKKKRNLLPNLQFLGASENKSKGAISLKDWVEKGNTIKYCPTGMSMELKDFDLFFEARKKLMMEELFKQFGLVEGESHDAEVCLADDENDDTNGKGNSWYTDILNLIRQHYSIGEEFTMTDMKTHEQELAANHPNNKHVVDKIRYELQMLRNNGVIEFLGGGHYRRIS